MIDEARYNILHNNIDMMLGQGHIVDVLKCIVFEKDNVMLLNYFMWLSHFYLQIILTHSRSRVVLKVLKEAAQAKKRFTVYVTESLPDKVG